MKAFYNPLVNQARQGIDSTRKHELIAAQIERLPNFDLDQSSELVLGIAEKLAAIHSPSYIEALRQGYEPLASSSGIQWDEMTYNRALASCSTLHRAVLEACNAPLGKRVAGAICSGFHHACYDGGGGFCTLNGLVTAALDMQQLVSPDPDNLKRILILDLDFHTGNGTADILERLHISGIHNVTIYGSAFGVPISEPLPQFRSSILHPYRNYQEHNDLAVRIANHIAQGSWAGCIFQAGMDPHERSAGGMPGMTTEQLQKRDHLVFKACADAGIPVAFCMAGGYTSSLLTREQLATLHCNTFKTANDVFI